MWISLAVAGMLATGNEQLREAEQLAAKYRGESMRLEIENARLRADLDWFKHRLNQVERERGQLIQAAIGIKISIPEFVQTRENPEEALQQMPDLSSVGGDAIDQGPETDADPGNGVDYSLMPGYSGKR